MNLEEGPWLGFNSKVYDGIVKLKFVKLLCVRNNVRHEVWNRNFEANINKSKANPSIWPPYHQRTTGVAETYSNGLTWTRFDFANDSINNKLLFCGKWRISGTVFRALWSYLPSRWVKNSTDIRTFTATRKSPTSMHYKPTRKQKVNAKSSDSCVGGSIMLTQAIDGLATVFRHTVWPIWHWIPS